MTKTEKNREEKKRKVVMPAGIRNKMVAAVSMLLVASIMMVSSTYAWFTLSTAPEVTGITTNVGANGNLEMMLLNKASFESGEENLGVESGVTDSMAVQDVTAANLKWGNLVDLASQDYGLQSIVMNPARLNIQGDATNGYTLNSALLKAPTYTSDGRVLDVDKDTQTSGYSTDGTWKWDETAENAYGVRVIGTTSGMTERLTAYRAAISARAAAIESAKNNARQSLLVNGQALANIVVKAALEENPSFERADLETLRALIVQLKAANDKAGEAIVQTVLAYNLSDQNAVENFTDADVAKLKEAFNNATAGTLPSTFTRAADASKTGNITQPDGTEAAVARWSGNNTNIASAAQKLQDLIDGNKDSYSYTDISAVVNMLINKEYATVGGVKNPNRDKAQDIINNMTASNMVLAVEMESGSGIYADIAELVGDYTAAGLKVHVKYNALEMDVTTNMSTKVVTAETSATLPMIPKLSVGSAPAATLDSTVKPLLTDHYGYALDFGFRTNAAASNLLLQTGEIQRVYSGEGEEASTADATKGGGSYMEFRTSNTTNFSVAELRALMSALRVVFVEPDQKTAEDGTTTLTYNVLGVAAADITRSSGDNGATYTYTGGTLMKDGTALAENADTATANGLKAELYLNNYEVDGGILTLKGKKTTGEGAAAAEDNTLTALNQNVAKKVTAIVYLDGDLVDNTMVANAASSMTGSLNLQFSSSATLKPMENTGMRDGGKESTTTSVTYTRYKEADDAYEQTISGTTYTIVVNQGYAIYTGSDGNYYYVYNDNGNYVRVTDSGILMCPAVTVSIKQAQTGN